MALPDGPRGTMARLRGEGRHALLESALPMPRQAQWSYIAGPALATLYTDESTTRLERDGREIASWDDPFEALAAVATGQPERVRFEGDCPEGMDFVGGWVGVLGYDLARHVERLPVQAAHDPMLPQQWWMAVDQVLGFHHPSGQWREATVRGPAGRWPWTDAGRAQIWAPYARSRVRPAARARPLACRCAQPAHLARAVRERRASHPRGHRPRRCAAGQPDAARGGGLRGRCLGLVRRPRVGASGTVRGLPRRAGLRDRQLLARALPASARRQAGGAADQGHRGARPRRGRGRRATRVALRRARRIAPRT